MSVVTKKNKRRLLPWYSLRDQDFLSLDDFFMNDFFNDGNLLPALNVKEEPAHFSIELAAPGFAKEDFTINIEDRVLLISGENSEFNEEQKEDDNYIRKEFNFSSFKRAIKLPKTADADKEFVARYQDGILKLQIPKQDLETEDRPKRTIEVI